MNWMMRMSALVCPPPDLQRVYIPILDLRILNILLIALCKTRVGRAVCKFAIYRAVVQQSTIELDRLADSGKADLLPDRFEGVRTSAASRDAETNARLLRDESPGLAEHACA